MYVSPLSVCNWVWLLNMEGFTESQLIVPYNPLFQIQKWVDEEDGSHTAGMPLPMCLSTVGSDGTPSGRYVSYCGIQDGGFPFCTDSTSRKAREFTANPKVSLTMLLSKHHRQIRIEGIVKECGKELAEAFFNGLSRERQITLMACNQDIPIESRETLLEMREKTAMKYRDPSIPMQVPESQSSYTVLPNVIELYQGSIDWMADRIVFKNENDKWNVQRLAP